MLPKGQSPSLRRCKITLFFRGDEKKGAKKLCAPLTFIFPLHFCEADMTFYSVLVVVNIRYATLRCAPSNGCERSSRV